MSDQDFSAFVDDDATPALEEIFVGDPVAEPASAPAARPTVDDAQLARLQAALSERDARLTEIMNERDTLRRALDDAAPAIAAFKNPAALWAAKQVAAGAQLLRVPDNFKSADMRGLADVMRAAKHAISTSKHRPLLKFSVEDISTMRPSPPATTKRRRFFFF
jgi:hypothetical protein